MPAETICQAVPALVRRAGGPIWSAVDAREAGGRGWGEGDDRGGEGAVPGDDGGRPSGAAVGGRVQPRDQPADARAVALHDAALRPGAAGALLRHAALPDADRGRRPGGAGRDRHGQGADAGAHQHLDRPQAGRQHVRAGDRGRPARQPLPDPGAAGSARAQERHGQPVAAVAVRCALDAALSVRDLALAPDAGGGGRDGGRGAVRAGPAQRAPDPAVAHRRRRECRAQPAARPGDHAQRRGGRGHGHGQERGGPLAQGQLRHARDAGAVRRPRRHHPVDHQILAHDAADADHGGRRLPGAAARADRRLDDGELDPDGPGAGAGRGGDRQLEDPGQRPRRLAPVARVPGAARAAPGADVAAAARRASSAPATSGTPTRRTSGRSCAASPSTSRRARCWRSSGPRPPASRRWRAC